MSSYDEVFSDIKFRVTADVSPRTWMFVVAFFATCLTGAAVPRGGPLDIAFSIGFVLVIYFGTKSFMDDCLAWMKSAMDEIDRRMDDGGPR